MKPRCISCETRPVKTLYTKRTRYIEDNGPKPLFCSKTCAADFAILHSLNDMIDWQWSNTSKCWYDDKYEQDMD